MRRATTILIACALAACSSGRPDVESDPNETVIRASGSEVEPDAKNPNASENASVAARLGIPPGHLPPAGKCKVWIPGEPPGKQKKKYEAGDCADVRTQVPAGGWLVYRPGEDKKEVVVREYGAGDVIIWQAVFDAASGAFLRSGDESR